MSYSFGESLISLSRELDDALDQIDRELAGLEDRLLALLLQLVAQRDADARDQFLHAERLRHIVVGAELQRLDDAGLVGAARQDQDRQIEPLLAPFAQQVMAGHVGQAEIEQDEVGLLELDVLDRVTLALAPR
jgi:hypothetical protein